MTNFIYLVNLYILLIFFLFLCIIKTYYYYEQKDKSKIVVATEVSCLTDVVIIPSSYNN